MKFKPAAISALVIAFGFLGVRYVLNDGGSGDAAPGAALAEVAVPMLSGEAKAGEELFNANCAACHGANAAGQAGIAPPLVHVIYEPGHHSDAAFHLAAQRGVRAHHWPFGDMPPVQGVGATEVDKIVAFVRALQRANGIH
jgi:mono/diheme cytochrome c family protein